MKLANILLGGGILASSAAFASWTHHQASGLRLETTLLTRYIGETRVMLADTADEIASVRRQIEAMDKEKAGLEVPSEKSPAETSLLSQSASVPLGLTSWQEGLRFIDLPKSFLKSIQFLPLNPQHEITPEAATLLGLTPEQLRALNQSYADLHGRFEQLERDHFEPTNQSVAAAAKLEGVKISFVLHAFPAESDALKREWEGELDRLIGANRAEFLSEFLNRRITPDIAMRSRGSTYPGQGRMGLSWLKGGQKEVRLTVTFHERFDGPVRTFDSEDGDGRSSSSGPRFIPERWRHLITEEMLQPAAAKE